MTNNKLTASRFLPECLKPEEISGEKRQSRLNELMNWFDRYYDGNANPKWFKSHVAELCYYILSDTELQERRKTDGAEPIGWTDAEELRSVEKDGCGYLFKANPITPHADPLRVIKLYAVPQSAPERDQIRREHAEWADITFGNIGPVGPLKHLSQEALEAAAAPGDLSEWADMQFLLWDAQRRAGYTDEQITKAMVEKLAVNKARQWPEPKDGEPRMHIKPQPAPEITAGFTLVPTLPTQEMAVAGGDTYVRCEEVNQYPTDAARRIWAAMVATAPLQEVKKTTVAKEIATGARLTDHRFKI